MGKTKSTPYNPNHISIIKMDSQVMPVFTEVRDKDWIAYGKENDYPYYLLDLYNKSAKHNAIINGKLNYLIGDGWKIEKPEEGLDISKLQGWMGKCNPYETFDEVSRKFLLDYLNFGGLCFKVIWNKSGRGLPVVTHLDWSNVRTNADGDQFFYTKNWFKIRNGLKVKNREVEDEEDWEVLDPYDPSRKKGTQLFYLKSYRPNLDVYPLPAFIGAVQYIDVDTEIANYHYNNLKNGFTSTYMLKFYNGIPEPEEQKKIENLIKEKLAGSSNAGKFILNFSDGKDRSAEVEVIPMSDSDEQFNILNETVQQEIFTGHQISSPMLFGIKTEGQLGGRAEMIEANELFQNTWCRPNQKFIEENINSFITEIGLAGKLKLSKLEPIGLDYFENNLWNVLTDEEKREKAGLKELPPNLEKSNTVDKLNTMSPLLANKVLNSLTNDEIRTLIGFAPLPPGTILPGSEPAPTNFQFKANQLKADHILWHFENCGESKKDYEILESIPLEMGEVNLVRESEKTLFGKKSDYITKLNANDRAMIDLLSKDGLIDAEGLAKALKLSVKEVQSSLRRLEKNGLINSKENKEGHIIRTPIEKAIDIVDKQGAKTEEIFVKYSYEWRAGFSDRDINTSRDFCKRLLSKDKLYTREEIEKLNNDMDLSVWESRGGWYTPEGTDTHLPFCRHIWVQNLVRKF